jgi:hypothetical protein
MKNEPIDIKRARASRHAIERIYVTMRHLLNRGFYKPMGVSGDTLREALLELSPEIYGAMGTEKIELQGLLYVLDRLPVGIEQCTFINLTSDEGYQQTILKPIIPPKRRRNCYRIDADQMNIEITRGRSDIYDILTHLTFLFIESQKIAKRVLIATNKEPSRDWEKIAAAVYKKNIPQDEREINLIFLANILGRSYKELNSAYRQFASKDDEDRFLKIIYWMGKLAIDEINLGEKRTITFSPNLRERLGHHIHGEQWAKNIKLFLLEKQLLTRPLHIISANMHSVMNVLYIQEALKLNLSDSDKMKLFESLSEGDKNGNGTKISTYAQKNGLTVLKDTSGTNIDVQIIDTAQVKKQNEKYNTSNMPVLIVMDYAFGEQAYESIDELLKPTKNSNGESILLNVVSISIMGKAGILDGDKGDLMIPTAHIYEGTADNYPFKNELSGADFKGDNINVVEGNMITVLGTSLQNKAVLNYFKNSTWRAIGLEMEGAHYQKAIQSASRIRNSISEKVQVRYAYYASDNPLETGSTLASGSLGLIGVKPTYLITQKILLQILGTEM